MGAKADSLFLKLGRVIVPAHPSKTTTGKPTWVEEYSYNRKGGKKPFLKGIKQVDISGEYNLESLDLLRKEMGFWEETGTTLPPNGVGMRRGINEKGQPRMYEVKRRGNWPTPERTGVEKKPKYLFRAVSEEDFQRILKQGYIDTDQRGNISLEEGTVTEMGDPGAYLPRDKPGRIVRIRYRDEDGWRVDPADHYIKTNQKVPVSRIDLVSPRIDSTSVIPEGRKFPRLERRFDEGIPKTSNLAQTPKGAIRTPSGMEAFSPTIQKKILEQKEKLEKETNVDLSEEKAIQRLLALHDKMKESTDYKEAKDWYQSAHDFAQSLADKNDMSVEQTTGIIAALSPQKGWGVNMTMATMVAEVISQNPRVGKIRVSDMTPKELALLLSGRTSEEEKTLAGADKKLFTQSKANIEKAIRIARGGDPNVEMGQAGKVRSFYNNILFPNQHTSVTIDTHMRNALMHQNYKGEVGDLDNYSDVHPKTPSGKKGASKRDVVKERIFQGSPSSKPENYDWGMYPYWASVMNEAARRRGILPHEMQAATWVQYRIDMGEEWRDGEGAYTYAAGLLASRM